MKITRAERALINIDAAIEQLEDVPPYSSILKDAQAFYNYETGTGEHLDVLVLKK